jgi:hypothetical protein
MPIRPPANILAALLVERQRMTHALAQTIHNTFAAAEVGCVGDAGEVDRLVYFFAEGLPVIEAQFNRILTPHGITATLSGIFCHQTPQVMPEPRDPSDKGCELGDIMFLATYGRRLYGNIVGNALLVQAKENAYEVDGTVQEHLYARANAFEYTRPGALARQQRFLGECALSLWFWGFNADAMGVVRRDWKTEGHNARGPHYQHAPFENVLTDLICGTVGRRFWRLGNGAPDRGWSKIVDDVVRVTARTTLRRQNAYIVRNADTLRGEDAVRVIRGLVDGLPPYLIRCSLARVLGLFDDEIAKLAAQIEAAQQRYTDEFVHEVTEKHPDMEPKKPGTPDLPPPIGNERGLSDDNGGGGSFVIMDFSPS